MQQPLLYASLVDNINQFLEAADSVVTICRKTQKSEGGMMEDATSLQEKVQLAQECSNRIVSIKSASKDLDYGDLHVLALDCVNASKEMIALVEHNIHENAWSPFGPFNAAARPLMPSGSLEELERRLQECCDGARSQNAMVTSQPFQDQLSALLGTRTKGNRMLLKLQTRSTDLQYGAETKVLGQEAQARLGSVLLTTGTARDYTMQHHIRKSLAFSDMLDRWQRIESAHNGTLQWFVDDQVTVNETSKKLKARLLFAEWLTLGKGIFHVAGKPGSGKSTFMKFLIGHPTTKVQLQKWAGQRELIFVNFFFFWSPNGTQYPKTIAGLLRSALHDILKQCPDLVEKVFPDQWTHLLSIESSQAYDCSMTDSDVESGFNNLLRISALENRRRLCFFIDALDECDMSGRRTFLTLVELLNGWITTTSGAIKICVSSREDNVFRDNFPSSQRIHLQDLTQDDMLKYARKTLSKHPRLPSSDCERLVPQIVAKSEGVFLWTTLVVMAMVRSIQDYRTIVDLERELTTLPSELNDLFRRLFLSISSTERPTAYRLFAMVMAMEVCTTRLSASAYPYLVAFERDPQFAVKEISNPNVSASDMNRECGCCSDPTKPSLEAHTSEEGCIYYRYDQVCNAARAAVQGYCKGMIEMRDWTITTHGAELPEFAPVGSKCLVLTHRSVAEFLEEETIQTTRAEQTVGFNVEEAISQVHLANFARLHPALIDPAYWTSMYTDIIALRSKHALDTAPFAFLECLTTAITSKYPDYLDKYEGQFCVSGLSFKSAIHADIRFYEQTERERDFDYEDYETICLDSPFHIAAYFGNAEYAKWKLDSRPELLETAQAGILLLHCLLIGLSKSIPVRNYEAIYDCFDNITTQEMLTPPHNLWPRLILAGIFHIRNREGTTAQWKLMGQLITLFLRKATDDVFHTLCVQCLSSGNSSRYLRAFTADNNDEAEGGLLSEHLCGDNAAVTALLDQKGAQELKLRELVEIWDFENNAEIFELIDDRERAAGGSPMQTDSPVKLEERLAIRHQK